MDEPAASHSRPNNECRDSANGSLAPTTSDCDSSLDLEDVAVAISSSSTNYCNDADQVDEEEEDEDCLTFGGKKACRTDVAERKVTATNEEDEEELHIGTNDLNRVHEELEKLNIATDVINKLEVQLDEARAIFREIQASWSQRLDQLNKKIGGSIEKARPYYEMRLYSSRLQDEAQKAAIRFERANSLQAVAKQQVKLTQDSLMRQKNVDPACLEVLNHHIQRVNEAEQERLQNSEEHKKMSSLLEQATKHVIELEQELRRHVKKSRPYFDTRVEFTKVLENQKLLIQRIEAEIRQKKADYTTSLKNLEKISERIHEERQVSNMKTSLSAEPILPFHEENSALPQSNTMHELLEASNSSSSPSADVSVRSRPAASGLGSGVILLAQRLSRRFQQTPANGTIESMKSSADEHANSIDDDSLVERMAFSFPPDQLDMQYRCAPQGVKPLPSPPLSPQSCVFPEFPTGGTSDFDTSSAVSSDLDLQGMLASHVELMQEIDSCATRAKTECCALEDVQIDERTDENANSDNRE